LIQEIERINEIVTELLMLAKPQLQPFEEASIKEIIHNIVNLLSTEANLNNVTLFLKADQDFPVSCSVNQLKQVVINIFKNSIDSISTKGNCMINLTDFNEREFLVRFQDNGRGMDEERLKRIGETFFSVRLC
jgi:two-component system, sporulation sensor kinase A